MFISAQKTVTDLIEDKILPCKLQGQNTISGRALQDNWRISDRKHVQRFQNRWGGFTDVRARC
jgi:hypothetical protein